MAPRGGPQPGPATATRYSREFLARMGLPPQASEEDIEATLDAAADFLRGAPPRLIRWARHEIAALERGAALFDVPAGDVAATGEAAHEASGSDTGEAAEEAAAIPRQRRSHRDQAGDEPDADAAGPVDAEPDDLEDIEDIEDIEDDRDADRPPARTRPRGSATRRGAGRARRGNSGVAPRRGSRADQAPRRPLWRSRTVQVLLVLVLLGGAGFGIWWSGKSSAVPGIGTPSDAAASPSATPIDPAKLSALMQKIQANPKDITSLQAVADMYFAAADYKNAAVFEQKVLDVDPKNISALMGLGASDYNSGDTTGAKKSWLQAIAINPKLAEAHYNLGFLYMSQSPPDPAAAKAEWDKVIAIDPNSDLAKSIATHLSTLTDASASPSPSQSGK